MNRRALLLVQGINANGKYLKDDFEEFRVLKSKYQDYENAPVDKSWGQTWVSHIPFIGGKFGDIWSFYKNEKARIRACEMVRERILDLKKDFESVDILTHSLGTVITLCSGPTYSTRQPPIQIDTLYLIQSPLGLGIPILDDVALSHGERHATNFIAKRIINLYSSKDIISWNLKPSNQRAMNILERCSIEPVQSFDLACAHDSFEAFDRMVKQNLWL